jgi:hypothetical protein
MSSGRALYSMSDPLQALLLAPFHRVDEELPFERHAHANAETFSSRLDAG